MKGYHGGQKAGIELALLQFSLPPGGAWNPRLAQRLGPWVAAASAYLGLDGQDDFRQGHNEALEGNGDVLQHKVRDPHDP